jgi:hypothetical protein
MTHKRASVASYGYVTSSPILITLTMESLSSSETSVLTRAALRNIPEDAILHSHSAETSNPKKFVDEIFVNELCFNAICALKLRQSKLHFHPCLGSLSSQTHPHIYKYISPPALLVVNSFGPELYFVLFCPG